MNMVSTTDLHSPVRNPKADSRSRVPALSTAVESRTEQAVILVKEHPPGNEGGAGSQLLRSVIPLLHRTLRKQVATSGGGYDLKFPQLVVQTLSPRGGVQDGNKLHGGQCFRL